MEVLKHTLEVTPDEIETIGEALCSSIRQTLKDFADKNITVDNYIEDEVKLLQNLTYAGFTFWLTPADKDFIHGKLTPNVDEWVENEKKLALAKSLKE